MNIEPHLDALITGLITSFVGAFSYFYERIGNKRKLNAEARSAELDNVEKALEIYEDVVEKLKLELQSMSAKLEENAKELQSLKEQLKEVDKQWKQKLSEKNDYWLKRYKILESQFEEYKKNHP